MNTAYRRTVYVFAGLLLLSVTVVAVASGFAATGASQPVRATQLLNANYLTASDAKQAGIHGLLTISSLSSTGLDLSTSAGKTLVVPIKLTYVSFDGSVQSVVASFSPASGQYKIGSFDVSGLENFSPSVIVVTAAEPATTTLTFTMPNEGPMTFRLLPSGLTVTPTQGVAILFKNDIMVTVGA